MSRYQLGNKTYKYAASYLKAKMKKNPKLEKKIEDDDIKQFEQMADDYILSSSYKTSKKFGQEKVRSKGRYKRRK